MFLNIRAAKILALGVTAALALPVLAQDQQSAAEDDTQGQRQLFSRLDTNADGNINFEEFAAMPSPAFNRQDSNGDGSISRDEMLEQRFTRLDRDGNGLLSADELRAGQGEGRGGEGRRGEGQRGDNDRRQGEMRERMQNMTPEQRAQMRERMQNMSPEQRAQMRERMQQNAQPNAAPGNNGSNSAHDH